MALVHSEEGKGSTFEFNIVLDKLKDDTLYLLVFIYLFLIPRRKI